MLTSLLSNLRRIRLKTAVTGNVMCLCSTEARALTLTITFKYNEQILEYTWLCDGFSVIVTLQPTTWFKGYKSVRITYSKHAQTLA